MAKMIVSGYPQRSRGFSMDVVTYQVLIQRAEKDQTTPSAFLRRLIREGVFVHGTPPFTPEPTKTPQTPPTPS